MKKKKKSKCHKLVLIMHMKHGRSKQHTLSPFLVGNVQKYETLTHLTLSPRANVGLFNDMKTLS